MGYRTLHLTLGELRVADILLSNPPKADIATVRTYGAVRSSLQLRQSQRNLNKLNEKGIDLGLFQIVATPQGPQPIPLQWDDMLDPEAEILAVLQKRLDTLRQEPDAPTELLASLSEYKLSLESTLCERECALTDASLKTLNDVISKKDWTKEWTRDPETRRVSLVTALVSMPQMEIFENLADKVGLAITQKDEPAETT